MNNNISRIKHVLWSNHDSQSKRFPILKLPALLLLLVFLSMAVHLNVSARDVTNDSSVHKGSSPFNESSNAIVEITVGPFDIHRKYRSMEGPWVAQKLLISDLLASQKIEIPESTVIFVEGNSSASPSMTDGNPAMNKPLQSPPVSNAPIGLVATSGQSRELLWFTGVRLEVLDETNQPLPTAEFVCHLNIDVDPAFRTMAFPLAQHSGNGRLITLTQGQTEFYFPKGYAVPVASDEIWTFTFQAANRTTLEHRRLKQRLTISFLRDSQGKAPIRALYWYTPYIVVETDRSAKEGIETNKHLEMPNCLGVSSGSAAPNTAPGGVFQDSQGHSLTGHWVIPVGTHTWQSPIIDERDPGFAFKNGHIHAVWSHIHPLCTKVSLVRCNGNNKKRIYTATIKTKTKGGLEIEHIDKVLSKKGIELPAGNHYALEATYINKTNEKHDSMVTQGIFFEDVQFIRPNWKSTQARTPCQGSQCSDAELTNKNNALFCGIKNAHNSKGKGTSTPCISGKRSN